MIDPLHCLPRDKVSQLMQWKTTSPPTSKSGKQRTLGAQLVGRDISLDGADEGHSGWTAGAELDGEELTGDDISPGIRDGVVLTFRSLGSSCPGCRFPT